MFDSNHMIHICNSDCAINEGELLLSYALDYVINEAYDRSLFIDVWYESMNELEPSNKRIFLYETKLNIEQKIRRI